MYDKSPTPMSLDDDSIYTRQNPNEIPQIIDSKLPHIPYMMSVLP